MQFWLPGLLTIYIYIHIRNQYTYMYANAIQTIDDERASSRCSSQIQDLQ